MIEKAQKEATPLKQTIEEVYDEFEKGDRNETYNDKAIQCTGGQDALMNAAKQAGYHQKWGNWDMQFDFDDVLDYPLPEGYEQCNYLFPRATSQADMPACPFGDCRVGQYPAASSATN